MEQTEIKISENLEIVAATHPLHVFLMSGKQVAKGYGVTNENIRKHKSENSQEFVINKHFTVSNPHSKGGKSAEIFWTLRGIMRLGFLIKSEKAKIFRDWAEETLFNTVTGNITYRTTILREKAENQKKYKELEERLLENDDYLQLMKSKAAIMRTGKELKEMDNNIVNTQLDLFKND